MDAKLKIKCFASMHMSHICRNCTRACQGSEAEVLSQRFPAWHVTNHGCPAKVCGCPCATEEAQNNMEVNSRPTTFRLLSSHQVPGAQYHTQLQSVLQVPVAPPHPPLLHPALLQVVAVLLPFKSWRLQLYPASGLVDTTATNQRACSLSHQRRPTTIPSHIVPAPTFKCSQ